MAALVSRVNLFPIQQPRCLMPAPCRYLLMGVINSGSFGVVHKALDRQTGEIVAIKEEFHGMSPSTVAEISILKSLPPHPSIVQLKGVKVQSNHRVFVVMEYLETDLHRLTAVRRRPYSIAQVKIIMRKILEGVHHLHINGVIHRDLKPSNILVDTNAAQAQVKLCDFGLSTTERVCETPCMGTLPYMAPEMLKGEAYTCAIDMWSAGCIMAELMSRDVFFHGRSQIRQLECIERATSSPKLLRGRFNAAASLSGAPPLSRSGLDLLGRLLAYDPSNRITARQALNHAWFRH